MDVFEYLPYHVRSTMPSFHSHVVTATPRNEYLSPNFRDMETEAQSYEMTGTNHNDKLFRGQNQNYKTGLDFNLGRKMT